VVIKGNHNQQDMRTELGKNVKVTACDINVQTLRQWRQADKHPSAQLAAGQSTAFAQHDDRSKTNKK